MASEIVASRRHRREILLTQERLKEVLSYDPETGVFIWLASTARRIRVGDTAGSKKSNGYIQIAIDGQDYLAHRLAVLYMTGTLPAVDIDHRDRDRSDNRWSELRKASASQNGANSPIQSNNLSGFKGVSFRKDRGKWQAYICVNGKRMSLGMFTSPDEAHRAYCEAAKSHYGEFARTE